MGQLVQQDYEKMFPARPRAKQLAFKWLSEQRYADFLSEKKPTDAAYDHIQRLVSGLGSIKETLEKQFPDGSPFPSGLYSTAVKWEKSIKPAPKPEPTPEPPAGASSEEESAPTTAQASTGSQESTPSATPFSQPAQSAAPAQKPLENTKDAQANARKVALFLIEKEPEKPMGYRLLRSLRWDGLINTPPAEGGKTRLEGPIAQKISFLQGLVGKSDWKKALSSAETTFGGGTTHYWLDLQRISANACKELGDAYDSVHRAICVETALLIQRIPDIKELTFSDGTPFCDNATKDWLESDVAAILSQSGSNGSAGSGGEDPLKEEKKEINKLVSAGKIGDAVEILQRKINESGSERVNFKRSLLLGDLLISSKNADIALAILESLQEKIDRFHLDKWESDLAVESWCLLVKAYKIVSANKPQNIQTTILEKQNSILHKISCIDPKSALKLKT